MITVCTDFDSLKGVTSLEEEFKEMWRRKRGQ